MDLPIIITNLRGVILVEYNALGLIDFYKDVLRRFVELPEGHG